MGRVSPAACRHQMEGSAPTLQARMASNPPPRADERAGGGQRGGGGGGRRAARGRGRPSAGGAGARVRAGAGACAGPLRAASWELPAAGLPVCAWHASAGLGGTRAGWPGRKCRTAVLSWPANTPFPRTLLPLCPLPPSPVRFRLGSCCGATCSSTGACGGTRGRALCSPSSSPCSSAPCWRARCAVPAAHCTAVPICIS